MTDITIATPFLSQSLEGAAAAGYDTKRILKECGIPPALLEQSQARIALDNFILLQQRVMKIMNDEGLGLFDRPVRLGTFDLIAHAMMHCTNVGDILRRMCHYNNLFEVGFIHTVEENGTQLIYRLQRRHPGAVKNNYIATSIVMTIHRFLCWASVTRVPLASVHLDFPPPEWASEYRYIFYGFPVKFNQKYIELNFDQDHMALPNRQDAGSLKSYLARAPRNIFVPEKNLSYSSQIRGEILRSIKNKEGIPSMEEVAAKLAMHPQTLRRRLRDESTDFTVVRTQARRDVAIYMLSKPQYRIEDISTQLDFSESSAFVRAFKGWMGMTPMAYRKM
ncbi:AraC family transcriptional regulator [Zhongshania sp.]|jgi:AraC-like DNA-binding protein|uniref:AraC family transcriptional regulator n=1 Tax=Zhongshania sp. TaxID=1971902 RepID=UPI0039E42E3B